MSATKPPHPHTTEKSQAIRVADDHMAMIARCAELGRRTKQSVATDALDVGLGLVLLHVHNPIAARRIMNDLQAAIVAEMAALPIQS